MKKEARNLLLWIIGIAALILILTQVLTQSPDHVEIGYQKFKSLLREGRVEKLEMEGEDLRGKFAQNKVEAVRIDGERVENPSFQRLKDAIENNKNVEPIFSESKEGNLPSISTEDGTSKKVSHFQLKLPSEQDQNLQPTIDYANLIYGRPEQMNLGGEGTAWWIQLLLWTSVLVVILLIFWFYLSSRMGGQAGGGIMNIGKMKGEVFDKETTVDTSFEDVAGLESAKEDMKEVISFLKSPERFHQMGGEIPKGVLLVGPPGTGKTLMARAVAGEADVPFFSLTGSSFMEMFVGVGAARVRDLFDTAKENTPCIIFIDELESVGRKRGAGVGGGHDEREQTLNQLLSELDGFEKRDNIVVIGATNRPDILDPAILRPGRFDREISVEMPTVKERKKILDVHVKRVPMDEDVDLYEIAQGTPGFSGADLENVVNEAAIKAAREEDTKVRMSHFEFALDRIMLGREREGMVLSEEEKRLVAYHEAGHAIVAQFTEYADPLFKVTIIPRGKSLGCTQQIPEEEKYNYSKEYLLARIQVILGGRAVEHLEFDTFTTGGGDDLKKAKDISKKMVCSYGMSDRVGHVALGNGDDEVFLGQELSQGRDYSEKTAQTVDEEISRITSECFEKAVQTIKDHRDQLDRLAETLIEKETLERKQIYDVFGLEDEYEEHREREREQMETLKKEEEEEKRAESEEKAEEHEQWKSEDKTDEPSGEDAIEEEEEVGEEGDTDRNRKQEEQDGTQGDSGEDRLEEGRDEESTEEDTRRETALDESPETRGNEPAD